MTISLPFFSVFLYGSKITSLDSLQANIWPVWWVNPAHGCPGCCSPASHLTQRTWSLRVAGAEPPRDTGDRGLRASMKGETKGLFRNYMWTVSFPPSFCNHIFSVFLNKHPCAISVGEARTGCMGSKATGDNMLVYSPRGKTGEGKIYHQRFCCLL